MTFLKNHFARILITVILCAALAPSRAWAVRIVLVTDQVNTNKAQEVVAVFQSTPPFSRLKNLEFQITPTTAKRLGCYVAPQTLTAESFEPDLAKAESMEREFILNTIAPRASLPKSCPKKSAPIDRLIACDTPQALKYLSRVQKARRADFVLVVKADVRYGGSGGRFPVITTGSPATMALHELMHQLGFADEYAYENACEADIYCDQKADDTISKNGFGFLPGTSFNVAQFNGFNSYIDDADVRKRHGSQIPWLKSILLTTPLQVQGHIGTPISPVDPLVDIGLYPAITCQKASKRFDTWQADPRITIMRALTTNYIPEVYWEPLAKALNTSLGEPHVSEKVF